MSVPQPILGPAVAWIGGEDVSACCDVVFSDDPERLDEAATVASMLMYELSGRQFPGMQEYHVRPCRDNCQCFGHSAAAGVSWFWTVSLFPGGGTWQNECGDSCGCGADSRVKLAGYPVREIVEVKIDGVVVDPSGYRLDQWRWLTRLRDPAFPAVPVYWPGCQALSLPDTMGGTWSITYQWGVDPPPAGISAAAALACELYNACTSGECKLPSRVSQVVRQGVTMDRLLPLAPMLWTGQTGIPAIDTFQAVYNPSGMRRRPAVWSPDVSVYPRRIAG